MALDTLRLGAFPVRAGDDTVAGIDERATALSRGAVRGRGAWMQVGRVVPRSAAATWRASRLQRAPVPRLQPRPTAWPFVFFDDLLITVMTMRSMAPALASDFDRVIRDAEVTVRRLDDAGLLHDPEALHPAPPVPTSTHSTMRSRPGVRFEHVSFGSGYQPVADVPGHDRWAADEPNAVAHAYVLRHDDEPRPWVLALHPYGAGEPRDLLVMGSLGVYRQLGVNVIHPVAPRHGPRGRDTSGVSFPSPDAVMSFLGVSQAMWDLRQWVGWIRSQGATSIAAYGFSFGGYCAALLAGLEPGLDCVVPAAPVVDLRTMVARHLGRILGRDSEVVARLSGDAPIALSRLISPLTFQPKVARSSRYIFAAVGDRLTPPEQAVQLWHHWNQPEIRWHQGGHVSGVLAADWRRFVRSALRRSGVVSDARSPRSNR